MKRFLFFILAFLLWQTPADARIIVGQGGLGTSLGITADCSEDFTTADTLDVAGNTAFDAEDDTNSKLSIVSNALVFSADDPTAGGAYVSETSCVSDTDTELTIKGTINFSAVTSVDDSYGSLYFASIYDDANSELQAYILLKASGGDVSNYRIMFYHDGGTASGDSVVLTGIAANTAYPFWIHVQKGSTTGGASCQIGSWTVSTTAYNLNNSLKNGFGTVRLGPTLSAWGDGLNDALVTFDDFEIYKSDQR